jgi:tetratricopeptide (TPR) repeat protein
VLRNDILAIQETVKSLNPKSAPASRELPPLPMPRATRTPREEAQELLAAAREAEATGHLEEADRFLAHIQRLDPEFLEAYEARARLFEARDMRGEAAGQWSEILRRSIESPLYQQAVAERLRLSQLAAPATAADAPALRIAGVQQSRFQGTADYDEMRMLNVALAPRQPGVRLDREAVRVEVTFYDRDPESGEVVPTEARVEQEPLQAQAAWGQAVEGTVSATYVVPKGLRARQREAGQPRVFHGYRVQVFYHDQPQDEAATPKTLLATVAAPTP